METANLSGPDSGRAFRSGALRFSPFSPVSHVNLAAFGGPVLFGHLKPLWDFDSNHLFTVCCLLTTESMYLHRTHLFLLLFLTRLERKGKTLFVTLPFHMRKTECFPKSLNRVVKARKLIKRFWVTSVWASCLTLD